MWRSDKRFLCPYLVVDGVDQYLRAGRFHPQVVNEVEARHIRKFQVHRHEVETFLLYQAESFFTGAGGVDVGIREGLFENLPYAA